MGFRTFKLPTAYELALSGDGDRLAVVGRSITLIDIPSRKKVWRSRPLPHPSSACFSADGRSILVKNTAGRAVQLAADTGDVISILPDLGGEGPGLACAPDGRSIVDASWGGSIAVYDGSGASQIVYGNQDELVCGISVSADGEQWVFLHQPKTLADANFPASSFLTCWNWPLTTPSLRMAADFDKIYAAALSPDGEHLALLGARFGEQEIQLEVGSMHAGEYKLVFQRTVETSGCGHRLRWAANSTTFGVVEKAGIAVYRWDDKGYRCFFPLDYASDVVFAPDLSFIAVAGWEGGMLMPYTRTVGTVGAA